MFGETYSVDCALQPLQKTTMLLQWESVNLKTGKGIKIESIKYDKV
jgi:hypothetical protein